mgnify:CR=1 FL=1
MTVITETMTGEQIVEPIETELHAALHTRRDVAVPELLGGVPDRGAQGRDARCRIVPGGAAARLERGDDGATAWFDLDAQGGERVDNGVAQSPGSASLQVPAFPPGSGGDRALGPAQRSQWRDRAGLPPASSHPALTPGS